MRALVRFIKQLLHSLRQLVYRIRLGEMGTGVDIEPRVVFEHPRNTRIGSGVLICTNCVLRANTETFPGITLGRDVRLMDSVLLAANKGHVSIGERSWFGPFCLVYGNGGVDIGSNVLVAAHTSINTVSHNSRRCDIPINDQGLSLDPVVIEDDVWLGLHVVVLQGVRIGRGSIVGAGSVVTKDIPPWSIALGTPARVVRRREGAPDEGVS